MRNHPLIIGFATLLLVAFGVFLGSMIVRRRSIPHLTRFSLEESTPKCHVFLVGGNREGNAGEASERWMKYQTFDLDEIGVLHKFVDKDGRNATSVRIQGVSYEAHGENWLGVSFFLLKREDDPDIHGNLLTSWVIHYKTKNIIDSFQVDDLSWNSKDDLVVWRGADFSIILSSRVQMADEWKAP